MDWKRTILVSFPDNELELKCIVLSAYIHNLWAWNANVRFSPLQKHKWRSFAGWFPGLKLPSSCITLFGSPALQSSTARSGIIWKVFRDRILPWREPKSFIETTHCSINAGIRLNYGVRCWRRCDGRHSSRWSGWRGCTAWWFQGFLEAQLDNRKKGKVRENWK